MEEKSLLGQLTDYAAGDCYPFHMPGHKRSRQIDYIPAQIDITEIEGFDNLHHATGILKRAQQRAAELYGAEESYFLVNGSTAGILAAVSACVRGGGRLLMARNCHKSAYHAAFLRNIEVTYLYPQVFREYGICGGILSRDVRDALEAEPSVEAVLITSPTYEGMLSDIAQIADIVHEYGKILIVDEAHGAHLGIGGPAFTGSAVTAGADIVIQSLHKTLPSLTQTAILHVQGKYADRHNLRKYLQIYQTSSPSYVLMAGMDSCIRLMEESGRTLFDTFSRRLDGFYERVSRLKYLEVLQPAHMRHREECAGMDASKICVMTTAANMTGKQLITILLEKYNLQCEMAAGNYVLAMTSVMDTEEGLNRLADALIDIDDGIWRNLTESGSECTAAAGKGEACDLRAHVIMSDAAAQEQPGCYVPFAESAGRISKEYRYVYPPGVPLLVPGEQITPAIVDVITMYRQQGLEVLGAEGRDGQICVVCSTDDMEMSGRQDNVHSLRT